MRICTETYCVLYTVLYPGPGTVQYGYIGYCKGDQKKSTENGKVRYSLCSRKFTRNNYCSSCFSVLLVQYAKNGVAAAAAAAAAAASPFARRRGHLRRRALPGHEDLRDEPHVRPRRAQGHLQRVLLHRRCRRRDLCLYRKNVRFPSRIFGPLIILPTSPHR